MCGKVAKLWVTNSVVTGSHCHNAVRVTEHCFWRDPLILPRGCHMLQGVPGNPHTTPWKLGLPFQVPRCMLLRKCWVDLNILTLATMLAGGTLSSLKGVTFLQDNNLSSVVRSPVLF